MRAEPATRQLSSYREFDALHKKERELLGISEPHNTPAGVGLAFSGGGIRSASFALGVLQRLLNSDLFCRFDYLSTVSGGGYLGASVSWWAHQAANDLSSPTKTGRDRYAAFREQFGSKTLGARNVREAAEGRQRRRPWTKWNWLAYLRQHGNYLQPPHVGLLSLGTSILRVCLYSVLVYLATLTGVFGIFRWLLTRDIDVFRFSGATSAVLGGLIVVLVTLAYGPMTWVASTWKINPNLLYRSRNKFRQFSGLLMSLALAALILWSVRAVADYLECHGHTLWKWATSASGLGVLGAVYQFWRGRARSKAGPSVLDELRVVTTATLVLYGLLLSAYVLSGLPTESLQLCEYELQLSLGALVLALSFGFFVNLNYAGVGRLYRDRLMETFLPNVAALNTNTWHLATDADVFPIASLEGRIERNGDVATCVTDKKCQRPLHLVNCNVVLLDSPKDIFRTRGGDSFCISPLYSGSNATGWVETKTLGDNSMTLATAMSISGAAVNPNSAPNGQGVTRNRMVAFLMSVFSVRLGYWLANPNHTRSNRHNRPNLWLPGTRQGLFAQGLCEDATFIELSDGGHFDNTGIYELVRRRTKLIVVSSAGYDPDCVMGDLANVIEKVRVDFSVFIEFDDPAVGLERLHYEPGKLAESGFAIGRIRYPNSDPSSPSFSDGYLLYLQSIPTSSMPADVESYRGEHPEFPSDPTSDQFFDEPAVEAYRELGYAIAGELSGAVARGTIASFYVEKVRGLLA
jgi:hypothetical protein